MIDLVIFILAWFGAAAIVLWCCLLGHAFSESRKRARKPDRYDPI